MLREPKACSLQADARMRELEIRAVDNAYTFCYLELVEQRNRGVSLLRRAGQCIANRMGCSQCGSGCYQTTVEPSLYEQTCRVDAVVVSNVRVVYREAPSVCGMTMTGT